MSIEVSPDCDTPIIDTINEYHFKSERNTRFKELRYCEDPAAVWLPSGGLMVNDATKCSPNRPCVGILTGAVVNDLRNLLTKATKMPTLKTMIHFVQFIWPKDACMTYVKAEKISAMLRYKPRMMPYCDFKTIMALFKVRGVDLSIAESRLQLTSTLQTSFDVTFEQMSALHFDTHVVTNYAIPLCRTAVTYDSRTVNIISRDDYELPSPLSLMTIPVLTRHGAFHTDENLFTVTLHDVIAITSSRRAPTQTLYISHSDFIAIKNFLCFIVGDDHCTERRIRRSRQQSLNIFLHESVIDIYVHQGHISVGQTIGPVIDTEHVDPNDIALRDDEGVADTKIRRYLRRRRNWKTLVPHLKISFSEGFFTVYASSNDLAQQRQPQQPLFKSTLLAAITLFVKWIPETNEP